MPGQMNDDVEDPIAASNRADSIDYGGCGDSIVKDPAACVLTRREDDPDRLLYGGADGRYPALDIIRVVCVWLVCIDHAGTEFGVYNTLYVQEWVLQYLFLICGICYGMTSKGIGDFIFRLGVYFCIGVACNWTTWVILGKDWRGGFWNVIFQFWFIVGLVLFVLLLAPLKAHIQKTRAALEKAQPRNVGLGYSILALLCGFVALGAIYVHVVIPSMQVVAAAPLVAFVQRLGPAAVFWGMPATIEEAPAFISSFLGYFGLSFGNMYIVLVFPWLSHKVSYIGWLMIVNTYAHKMFEYRAQTARLINSFDCVMLGMVCFYYGLAHRRSIGQYFVRYWFVLLFVSACLFPPGTKGRFDENPSHDLLFRAQYNFLECLYVVFFLVALERIMDPDIFAVDNLDWLGNWALLLFLFHKAIHMLVPVPFNYVWLLLLMVPCYLTRGRLTESKDASEDRNRASLSSHIQA